MSLQANPLIYLNMGGEMLYVLRQRLKAQKIAIEKSVRVVNEVTGFLLSPHVISNVFKQSSTASPIVDFSAIRSNLEKAVLSSIMRLDDTSMNKLFDLMTMMVKYQIQMATGPRELLLMTLNHMDIMRETLIDSTGHRSLIHVHRMFLQLYGNLTYEEMWQVRQACLIKLDSYNVRVSILLRLDLQRENGSFVPPKNRVYDERYEERRDDLSNLRLLENSCERCNIGSLELVGDRVTILGRNIYSSYYDYHNFENNSNKLLLPLDINGEENNSSSVGRAELGMLAVQLGNDGDNDDDDDDDYSSVSSADRHVQRKYRPFTLQLFSDNSEIINPEGNSSVDRTEPVVTQLEPSESNNRYKAQLNDIYTNMIVDEDIFQTNSVGNIKLLDLMDQLE